MLHNSMHPLQYKPGVRYSAPVNDGGVFIPDEAVLAVGTTPTPLTPPVYPFRGKTPTTLGSHYGGNFFTRAAAPTVSGLLNVLTPTAQPTHRARPTGPRSCAQIFKSVTSTSTLSNTKRTGTGMGCGECVVALIDNRASEVGVAICQLPSLTIVITQYGDSVTYAKTLSFIFSRTPAELLVPETVIGSNFVQTLFRHFHDTPITGVSRRSFDEAQGAHRLLELMSTDEASLEVSNTDRYLCLAAANAVVEFLETTYNYTLLPHTVRVKYLTLESYMEVSRLSARALNIIATGSNQLTRPPNEKLESDQTEGSSVSRPARKTLFRSSHQVQKSAPFVPLAVSVNYTVTSVGCRLLRSTLLQPLRDHTSIELRYDTVEWLCNNDVALTTLRRSLRSLGGEDMERVISNFSLVPKLVTLKTMQQSIGAVVSLWQLLSATRRLLSTLRGLVGGDDEGNLAHNNEDDGVENRSDCSSYEVDCSSDDQKELHEGEEAIGCSAFRLSGELGCPQCSALENRPKPPTLLCKLLQTLTVCQMEEICIEIARYLDEDVIHVTGRDKHDVKGDNVGKRQRRRGGAVLQVRQCFAVRSNINGTLDAARYQYSQTIEAMFAHVESLKQEYGVGSLRVAYDSVRGYHLSYDSRHECNAPDSAFLQKYSGGKHYALYHSGCSATGYDAGARKETGDQLQGAPSDDSLLLAIGTPRIWDVDTQQGGVTKHQVRGKRVICTTKEMLLLRRDADDAVAEILNTQDVIVHHLVEYLRQRLGKLQAVCDGVAMLDLLIAFATYSRLHGCVRPVVLRPDNPFSGHGTYFVEARHPGGFFAANTVTWNGGTSVLLLTGPNASGKTTLLRQVGQLIALAQSGCFVPAKEATIQPCDRVIAHMLCDDPENATTSSFAKEMRELSYICMHATRESVVLVDELGRRTAAREGMAIAWATVEFLVEKRCRTVFATHFSKLTRLEQSTDCAVKNVHLAVVVEEGKGANAPVGQDGTVVLVGGNAPAAVGENAPRPTCSKTCSLRFEYRLRPGPSRVDCYGLRLAARIGFYAPSLQLAWELMPAVTGGEETGLLDFPRGGGAECCEAGHENDDKNKTESSHSDGNPCDRSTSIPTQAGGTEIHVIVPSSACGVETTRR